MGHRKPNCEIAKENKNSRKLQRRIRWQRRQPCNLAKTTQLVKKTAEANIDAEEFFPGVIVKEPFLSIATLACQAPLTIELQLASGLK